jgi:Asp-tRNA(Asn)/Glu-tRNA(Gln) amidotransferase A subunit family amidase
MSRVSEHSSGDLHELTVTAAATAIRDGSLTAQDFAAALLSRSRKQADLNAFITLQPETVLEAAVKADQHRKSGKAMGPLHGVPISIKDSMCTFDMPTSIGTQVLAGFKPGKDAAVVAAVRVAGAILFGKNNLVEMSYGLTGVNEHYGQAKNPYDKGRITGGSSSGAAASVGGRLIPAALGGDTVGSIRVPASLCGVVGFRPTTGRWSGTGIAPISHTFDTPGPIARSVEDCALLDAIVTGGPLPDAPKPAGSLKGVRFGLAPRQFLDLIDADVEHTFHEAIVKLKAAGVEFVEFDLGEDFAALAERANWPVFFHDTMPHVTGYLKEIGAPATFADIYEGLGSNLKELWRDAVVAGGRDSVSETAFSESMDVHRPALQKRYADAFRSNGIDAMLFPTTPLVAPPLDTGEEVTIAGRTISSIKLAKNVFPSSCAALPGITIPMGLSSDNLPMGLEMDGRPGEDVKLLGFAAQISAILGSIPPPADICPQTESLDEHGVNDDIP